MSNLVFLKKYDKFFKMLLAEIFPSTISVNLLICSTSVSLLQDGWYEVSEERGGSSYQPVKLEITILEV